MTDLIQADNAKLAPSKAISFVSAELPDLSDNECVTRLARAIATYDSEHLDEVARPIGRLAVSIK
jgi:hypothetical protein